MLAFTTHAADSSNQARRLVGGAGAGTIQGALIEAYHNNPQLNSQRAATRAIDENVPTALSGYRPRITGTSSLTEVYLDNLSKAGSTPATGALYSQQKGSPRGLILRADHDPDIVQRFSDREPHAPS